VLSNLDVEIVLIFKEIFSVRFEPNLDCGGHVFRLSKKS
jgi:hypothetical protein